MEVISKLRNLQSETIQLLEEMAILYDLESDIRYLQGKEKGLIEGIEKGIEKGIEQGIEQGKEIGLEAERKEVLTKMLCSGAFRSGLLTYALIAEFVSLTEAEVEAFHQTLEG